MTRKPIYIDRAGIPLGGVHVLDVDADLRIAVFRTGRGFYAINDRCPHAGGSFAQGPFDGRIASCPLHQFQVDVTTGRSPTSSFLRVQTFSVVEHEDRLEVIV